MKRLVLFLIVTLLCISSSAFAMEEFMLTGIRDEEKRSEIIQSMAIHEGVYMLSSRQKLYRFDVEAQQATPMSIRNAIPEVGVGIDRLFEDGTALYGISEENGVLYRVELSGHEATLYEIIRLDFSVPPGKESFPSIFAGCVCNGKLYLIMALHAEQTEPSAYCFDIVTGRREALTGDYSIVEMVRYEDEHLLRLEEKGGTQWRITDVDTVTGDVSVLHESGKMTSPLRNVYGLIYDPWRGRVLLQSEERIVAFTGEESFEVVCYLQPNMWGYSRGILPDGSMVLARKSVYARSVLKERPLQKPLMIAHNGLDGRLLSGYGEAYADSAVKQWPISGAQAVSLFAEQINTKSDIIDIFELPLDQETIDIFEKGYYVALNQSPAIQQTVAVCRPFFREAMMKGGEIVAAPKTVRQSTLGYSRYALGQLGLAQKDIPATFEELLDFLLLWDERVGDAAAQMGITPFGITNSELKINFFIILMDQYHALAKKNFSKIAAYEADMARLLDKLTRVCEILPPGPGDKAMQVGDTFRAADRYRVNDQPSYLFTLNASFHPGMRNYSENWESVTDFVPVALRLPAQTRPLLLFEATVFVVNPYSTQKEKALHFLSYYMEHFPKEDEAALLIQTVPYESTLFRDLTNIFSSDMKSLEARFQVAQGVEKRDLEVQLETKRDDIAALKLIQWEVTQQALDDYQLALDRSDAVWLEQFSPGKSFDAIYRQYLFDGMEGNSVSHAFFDILKMMQRESQSGG